MRHGTHMSLRRRSHEIVSLNIYKIIY